MARKDKYKSDDSRLCCIADTARTVLQYFREERARCVRHLAGNRYSTNAALKKTYVNLISLYCNIVGRNLISKNPRVMLSTFDKSQKPAVSAAEAWMNKELVRQDFASTLQRIVLDALFSIGVSKCCLATPGDAATAGWGLEAGQPYLTRVDLDDFVFDHRARDFDEVQFIGHRYRMPYEMAMDFDHFDKKGKERLEVSYQIAYNRQGDERIAEIGRDFRGYDEDLYDMVDLWEFYLPQERVVKTFTEHDLSGPSSSWEGSKPMALRTQEWIGPETGPYNQLGFQLLPGNIFPKGPVLDLVELHEMANEGYRKLGREFAKFKKLTVCSRQNQEDGEAARNAKDGDMVPMHDPNSVKDVVMGGGDAGLFNWVKENIQRFMEQAGNLMTMGGLAPQAQTLGQEELLQQQSNGQVATMQDATTAFVSKCADNMLWYFWHDPRLVMHAPINDPKLPDVDYVRKVHPWNHPDPQDLRRQGPRPDIKIDPYSMRHTTPQQRVKDIMSIVQGIYTPMSQLFAQQGKQLDLEALLEILGKNMDLPELSSIITMGAAQGADDSNSDQEGGKPAETTRNYVRRSIGGASAQAQNMEQDNELSSQMSGGQKPRQMVH